MDDKLILEAANAIQQYLATRPTAADTVEGIHTYWIQWDDVPEMIDITESALLHLQQAGVVECAHVGNREVWRLCRTPGDSCA